MASYSEAVAEAMASAPTAAIILDTIEVSYPSMSGDPIRLVHNTEAITATIETDEEVEFAPCAFQFRRPAAGENGVQELTLTLDNVDRRVTAFIKAAKAAGEPITVTYRPYLASDLSAPQMDPPLALIMSRVDISLHQVVAKATFGDLLNMTFLRPIYSRTRFPALGDWV